MNSTPMDPSDFVAPFATARNGVSEWNPRCLPRHKYPVSLSGGSHGNAVLNLEDRAAPHRRAVAVQYDGQSALSMTVVMALRSLLAIVWYLPVVRPAECRQ